MDEAGLVSTHNPLNEGLKPIHHHFGAFIDAYTLPAAHHVVEMKSTQIQYFHRQVAQTELH